MFKCGCVSVQGLFEPQPDFPEKKCKNVVILSVYSKTIDIQNRFGL